MSNQVTVPHYILTELEKARQELHRLNNDPNVVGLAKKHMINEQLEIIHKLICSFDEIPNY